MSILLIGLNHRTAPVEVREQLAFSREGVATALLLFRNQFPRSEAAILSTCNRVEVLVASDSPSPTAADVVAFCRARMADYKVPREVSFHDDFPRDAAGKLVKRLLREPYWAGRATRV